jgi:LPS-assembly lipoprotein
MIAISRLLILILSFTVAACGYHLRGAYDLPKGMKAIYLEGGSSLLREQLLMAVKSSSGQLVDLPEKADVILRIYDEDIERRVLSLSQRGRSNDIELAGHLEFQLLDNKNGVLIGREPVDFRREYYNDQQDIIAKGNEEMVIKKELYTQVVRTIINRGRAVLEVKGK